MAPQIIAVFLVLQLCWLGSGMKDVQVGFDDDGYHFNIYVEGELWFRSGVLGVRHQGMWWSNEHKDAYTLQVEDSDGKVVNGRDSIGEYGGVQ